MTDVFANVDSMPSDLEVQLSVVGGRDIETVDDGGSIVFTPSPSAVDASQLTAFMRYAEAQTGIAFVNYEAFQLWAATEFREFWQLFAQWSDLDTEGSLDPICTTNDVETARFFPALRLNYAESLLRTLSNADQVDIGGLAAVTACTSDGQVVRLTRSELGDAVARVAAGLVELGLREGDRVAAVVRNTADAVVAALAVTGLGATFSSAAADMGTFSTLARFRQLDPTLLIAHVGQPASGAPFSMAQRIAEIAAGLPTLKAIVALEGGGPAAISDLNDSVAGLQLPVHALADVQANRPETFDTFRWHRFPFNHPLFVLFSSGTTGRPKCIVHGAGGTLLEHLKEHRLHGDLRVGDKLFFNTSAAWMMWNWQLSALACGAEIVLYDGPIAGPQTLWSVVSEQSITVFGTSPPYLRLCQEQQWSPREHVVLDRLRTVMSTGSILGDRQYDWVRDQVGAVALQSISGGTDILGCFVLGNPNLPVRRGEAQCRSLGMDVAADGATPAAPVGELICRNPFPSRPLGLYGDDDGSRFHAAYFAQREGPWTHGDRLELTAAGGARIHGRSDSVLNVNGVRVGPAEIYQILEDVPEIDVSMAVEQPLPDGGSRLVLLVQTRQPGQLTFELDRRIRRELAGRGSSAHVPAIIVEVPGLPTTFSGKRSEAAVRDLLTSTSSGTTEALANPDCLPAIAWQVKLLDGRHADAGIRKDPDDRPNRTEDTSTVEVLQRLMARALGTTKIDPDDNFFDLGADSLNLVELLQTISNQLRRDLAPSALLDAPTPRRLAAIVDASFQATASGPVVLRAGVGRPLFFLPGAGGDVFALRTLCKSISSTRPMYGLRARGLDPAQPPHRTVEEMASYYIERIRGIQQTGPYTLLGFSFGGLVGYEIARQLGQSGAEVDLLVMIDTHIVPADDVRRRRWERIHRLVDYRDIVTGPRKELPRALLQIAQRRVSWIVVPNHLLDMPPAMQRVSDEGDWPAYVNYRPRPFAQDVVFVRADKRRAIYGEPVADWQRLSGGRVSVVNVAGDHLSLLNPPHVDDVASQLTRQLELHG